MKEKDYKKKLKVCVQNAVAPNVLDEIKRADFSAYQTDDSAIIPQVCAPQKQLLKKKIFVRAVSAAAAIIIIFIFSFAILPRLGKFDNGVYATASVSVNGASSYSIEINKGSQVVDIAADSQTGATVLQNLSYKEKKFDGVLTALLKACVDYWNLDEWQLADGTITFSVNCHDSNTKTKLEHNWNNSMNMAQQHCREKHGNGQGSGHH